MSSSVDLQFRTAARGPFTMRSLMHRSLFLGLAFLLCTKAAISDEPLDASRAIDRGLAFLAKDAVAWREKHKCVSCHHAGMFVWAMNEAQAKGSKVDAPLLAELTKWIVESGDGRTGDEKPVDAPEALNAKALWYSLALGSVPKADDGVRKGQQMMLETLRLEQSSSSSWVSMSETRRPLLGNSEFGTTALATLALASAPADDSASRLARDTAVHWLESACIYEETQWVSMQLTLTSRLALPTGRRQPLIDCLLQRQNSDGGWSQKQELESDAWATGQALYAISQAGVESKLESVQRGKQF